MEQPTINQSAIIDVISSKKFSIEYDANIFANNGFFHFGDIMVLEYLLTKAKRSKFTFSVTIDLQDEYAKDRARHLETVRIYSKEPYEDYVGVSLNMTKVKELLEADFFINLPIFFSIKIKFRSIDERERAIFSDNGNVELMGRAISFKRNTNQYRLCESMFQKELDRFYSWEIVAEGMLLIEEGEVTDRKTRKRLESYVRAVNKKFKDIKLPPIFEVGRRELRRIR